MPANANSGWFCWNEPAGGPTLAAAPGATSSGGAEPIPNFSIPGTNASARSSPIWPNVVLHDSWKLRASVPPHDSPPKFFSVFVVWGSLSSVSVGKFVSGENCPVPSATDEVITLKVEPGGKRSRYARGRSGLSGLERRSFS